MALKPAVPRKHGNNKLAKKLAGSYGVNVYTIRKIWRGERREHDVMLSSRATLEED